MRSGLPCSGPHCSARVAVALLAPKKYMSYGVQPSQVVFGSLAQVSNIGCGMRAILDAIEVEQFCKVDVEILAPASIGQV